MSSIIAYALTFEIHLNWFKVSVKHHNDLK